jgi:predicted DNA-binding transcriptional regulator AlpA
MALTFVSRKPEVLRLDPAAPKSFRPKKAGHSKALPVACIDLQQAGRLRVGHLLTLFSVSHSTLYNRIRSGQIPQPDGVDGTRPFWKTETVRHALQK